MNIGIIDYGVGNLGSVANALGSLGYQYIISNDVSVLAKTDALILPGDGAAKVGMQNLQKLGLDQFIKKQIDTEIPFLGICLGMQLLMDWSEEGNVACLGIIQGKVRKISQRHAELDSASQKNRSRIKSGMTELKLPQIGWNTVQIKSKESRILSKIKDNSFVYFIHSYICDLKEKNIVTGVTEYGEMFCSVFEKENIFGVQFHPEKSGEIGLQMIKNFINTI